MEENKNQAEKVPPIINGTPRVDFYTKRSKKVGDFSMGFFGAILLLPGLGFVGIPGVVIGSIVIIGLCILFFRISRKYIAIGIISSILLPALIFGSCLAIFSISGSSF